MRGLELTPRMRPKVAWADDASRYGVNASSGGENRADVTDGIITICMVEEVEKIRT